MYCSGWALRWTCDDKGRLTKYLWELNSEIKDDNAGDNTAKDESCGWPFQKAVGRQGVGRAGILYPPFIANALPPSVAVKVEYLAQFDEIASYIRCRG